MGNPYSEAFVKSLHELKICIKMNESVLQACNRFLGLGIGLTPSGDDFLLGCLTTWQSCNAEIFSLFQDGWINQIKEKTTTVSYFMLKECIDGFVHQGFIDLFQTGELDKFLEIGSTSGIDMLIGALFALEMKV